jgi:membrane fusion protein
VKPDNLLFRREAIQHRAERLYGDVNLAVPLSWQVIGYLLLAGLVTALFFLTTASYARVETVSGAIVLDRGVASILPTRRGTIAAINVREGQRVRAGDPLVGIRSDEDMTGGSTTSGRIIEALERQDERLASQSSLTLNAADDERSRLGAQMDGVRREVASIDAQILAQARLVEVAANEFKEVQAVAAKGFISRRDINQRETTLITRRQQLLQLEQSRVIKVADLAQAQRTIAQTNSTARSQAAGFESGRAQLAQRQVEIESGRGYVLAAPIDGTVTAVTARLGQPASDQHPLMMVMAAGSTPRAELEVPTQAAGFLAIGQEVRLAVDAFPYQRFGTVHARIVQISSVAVPRATPDGGTIGVYLVTAEFDAPQVMAFGRRQPLLPGMTLSARIVTRRQSLFEWLFEPLFAVGRR